MRSTRRLNPIRADGGLRSPVRLVRWVLLWFALSVGTAIASPVVNPLRMELVCTSAGSVKAIVQTDEGAQEMGAGAMDCPLCIMAGAPPVQRAGTLANDIAGTALDTPFSVNTVPGELVREQGGSTLQEALRNVRGVQADSGFNGSRTQFYILRGAVADSGTGSNRVLRDGGAPVQLPIRTGVRAAR